MPPVKGAQKPASSQLAPRGIQLTTFEEVRQFSLMAYAAGASASFDRPEAVALAVLAGLDVGLSPTQALGSIMVANGKPSIYGDGALALVRASGLLEYIREEVVGEGDERHGRVVGKRVGEEEKTYTFSVADAKRANLWGNPKRKPWIEHPNRMLVMRPRGYFMRDVFPDVLRGLVTTEELLDYADVKVVGSTPDTPAVGVGQPATEAKALPPKSITAEQGKRLADLKASFCAAKNLANKADRDAAWGEVIAEYGVASAKQLTSDQADELIADLEKAHDFPTGTAAA